LCASLWKPSIILEPGWQTTEVYLQADTSLPEDVQWAACARFCLAKGGNYAGSYREYDYGYLTNYAWLETKQN
jgi:hypothetical protein